MGNRQNRIHPALKHAGYSSISVLPGENKAEFDKLHQDLVVELAANGALEADIVATSCPAASYGASKILRRSESRRLLVAVAIKSETRRFRGMWLGILIFRCSDLSEKRR